MERLSTSDWKILSDCGFNPGLSSKQIITSVKAAFSELTDHDAYVAVLHQIDDTLHDITEHHDLCVLPEKADVKKQEAHERAGHLPIRILRVQPALESQGAESYTTRDKNLIMEHCLRVKLTDDTSALLPWYVPLEDKSQPVVADAVFKVMVNTFLTIRSSRSLLWIWELECINCHPSNGIAERLIGMSKMLVKRLLESTSLTFAAYWNFAITHAADLLRHRALKVTYPHPAFGEMVGVWTSQGKKKTKALDPKGSVGRFLTCDTWWTGVTEILTTDEDGRFSLCEKIEAIASRTRHVQALASLWTVIVLPRGEPLWVRLTDGSTYHEPPFVVETMTEGQFRLFMKDKDPTVLIESDDEVAEEPHAELAQTTSEQKITSEETSISEETFISEENSGSEESGNLEEPLIDCVSTRHSAFGLLVYFSATVFANYEKAQEAQEDSAEE
eukprot:1069858-Amphidinium_carterae.1